MEPNDVARPAAFLGPTSENRDFVAPGRLLPLPPVAGPQSFSPPPRDGIFQSASFLKTLIPGGTGRNIQFFDLAVKATFGFPFPTRERPFLVTPGFTAHLLQGPTNGSEAPGHLFDSFVDLRWVGKLTTNLAYDIGVTPGLYGDYSYIGWHTLRVAGRGLGILTVSPTMQVALGIAYFDREDVKLFPVGGMIWTPNETWRFELIAPRPRIAVQLCSSCRSQWWGYVVGEFGGYSYTFTRSDGAHDILTYRDYRALVGLERKSLRGHTLFWEAGLVFGRTLLYKSGAPTDYPGDTALLRVGTVY